MHANPPYADQRCLRLGSPPNEKKLGAALAASRVHCQKIFVSYAIDISWFLEFSPMQNGALPNTSAKKFLCPRQASDFSVASMEGCFG
jgi:hypothetical protein